MSSCLSNKSLVITSIGRGIKSRALEKHRIKQADRLLSNDHFHAELEEIYRGMARTILDGTSRPVILLDWSNLDSNERHFLLRASVPTKGRSITVYEEVHTRKTKEKLVTHKKFLKSLSKILPKDVKPILVTDAGFKITWFKLVQRLGWNWVGRVRGRMKVKLSNESCWVEGRSLQPKKLGVAENITDAQAAKKNNLDCRLVLYKEKPKGRIFLNKLGKRSSKNRSARAEHANREPLLLSTSLSASEYESEDIVKMYSLRMQIEESFRDMKCEQYGLGLEASRTYKTKRMAVLVAIAALANLFSWILGRATEIEKNHRSFQANSITSSTVLSYIFLGIRVFAQRRIKTNLSSFIDAWKQIPFLVEIL
jgi:hypothetical protein